MAKLCFGGSFNPIHQAHLLCSEEVARRKNFEKVVLIPSKQPPHKTGQNDIALAEDRLEMCKLAAATNPELFEVQDLELSRPGPSYTIDTVRALRRKGWTDVDWLIGADMLKILPSWHKSKILIKEVEFVVMARPGWTFDWDSLPVEFRCLRENVVEAPLIDISATEIRRRVAAGESIAGMVPPAVEKYIHQHGLYQK